MLSPVVTGKVEKGKFTPDNPEMMKKAFHCHEGRRVSFCPKRIVKKRSDSQNRYYHGVIVKMAADAIGEDDLDSVHETLKAQCNYELVSIKEDGVINEYRKILSTAKLTTVDFENYCERCRRFLSTFFGIYVPLPNEVEL